MSRRGFALEEVGLIGAIGLPWILKFLWAPIVDHFGARRWGHYRSWILPLQALCVLTVLLIAVLDPVDELRYLLLAGAVFMFLSATQDVATDGLAVRALEYEERGLGNGIQVGGYSAGLVLGGGLVLVLFDHFGWFAAMVFVAVMLALPILPVLRYREGVYPLKGRPAGGRVDFAALRRFFARPGALFWALVLILYLAGNTAATSMLGPMLERQGVSLSSIGVMTAFVLSPAALLGALIGGVLVAPLGRKTALTTFGFLQAVALCGYVFPALGSVGPWSLYPVVAAAALANGMATAALYTCMMDRSDPGVAATDFTLQQSICAAGPMFGFTLSGISAAAFGFAGHVFICAGVAALGAVLVAWKLRPETAAHSLPAPMLVEGELG
jgi:predicted MFS family arabinose efflux permease